MFGRDRQKPVYVINGFLDSGKTSFFAYTLGQPYFQTAGKTLVVLCEEGEVEYGKGLLDQSNTVVEVIDDLADFTPSRLMSFAESGGWSSRSLPSTHPPFPCISPICGLFWQSSSEIPS